MMKIYSPNQIAVAAFVGGPIAAVYMLWSNFRSLGDTPGMRQTLFWGVLLTIALFGIAPFLPDRFPSAALPAAYAVSARSIAAQRQMTKQAIVDSDRYDFQSNWNVVGVSVLCLVIAGVILLAMIYGLVVFGLIDNPG
jgi:hypothetical protein